MVWPGRGASPAIRQRIWEQTGDVSAGMPAYLHAVMCTSDRGEDKKELGC